MIFPFDELNALKSRLNRYFTDADQDAPDRKKRIRSQEAAEDIIDELFDLFMMSLANGVNSVNEQFDTDIELPDDVIEEIVYKKIDGLTWVDRVWAWYEAGGDEPEITRIAETEAHRIGNEAAYYVAKRAGATEKTWICQLLPTSRDTHVYLDGVTVALEDEFYTFMGNHALFPGQFGVAEEDCNCLCEVKFS